MTDDLKRALSQGPITAFQVWVFALCVMLDGFDVLAMSFAASGVKAAWHLADRELGVLLSAGLVGMALGSLSLGPCADRFGRRPVILVAVALAGAGMLASAAARDLLELLVLRVATGIGIGGTIASVAVVVSEYSPDRWRATALATYATGYSIGATIGGAIAAYAIPRYGWRAAFVIGGAMSLVTLPVAFWRLPESLDFLLARRPRAALARVNALLGAMLRAPIADLPAVVSATRHAPAPWRLLLTGSTVLAWTVFFCTMASFYFIVSWTPRLLHAAGLSASQGLNGGVLLNLGGIAGCGLFAIVASRVDAHRLLAASLAAAAVLIVAFGLALAVPRYALWTALWLGVIANAAMAGLYAVGPPLYPAVVRSTGMGWAIGIGRLGAIAAPVASGALLDRGWAPADLYFVFAVPLVLAAIGMLLIGPATGTADRARPA